MEKPIRPWSLFSNLKKGKLDENFKKISKWQIFINLVTFRSICSITFNGTPAAEDEDREESFVDHFNLSLKTEPLKRHMRTCWTLTFKHMLWCILVNNYNIFLG